MVQVFVFAIILVVALVGTLVVSGCMFFYMGNLLDIGMPQDTPTKKTLECRKTPQPLMSCYRFTRNQADCKQRTRPTAGKRAGLLLLWE